MTMGLRALPVMLGSLVLAATLFLPASRPAHAADSIADMIAALQPAVVNISIVTRKTIGPVEGNMASQPAVEEQSDQSSGFFIAPSGIIVTNRHSIAGAREIFVTLFDTTRLRACLLTTASQSDIALLKVNAGRPVRTVALGDSDGLRAGDPIFIIGNPLGHGSTVTGGIVSALDRITPQSQFGSFFQIDASLNHGNSGGPVLNMQGEVVGIATALFSPNGETGSVGLGLAIPSNDAAMIVERLLKHGQERLGWIGLHIQPVTAEIAEALQLAARTGSIVTDIDEDSPATRAGLALGDVILKAGDDILPGPQALNHRIASTGVGTVVRLTIWRDGREQILPVVVGDAPDAKPGLEATPNGCGAAHAGARNLGLVLGRVTQDITDKLGLKPQDAGVLVTDVQANTAAADRGITPGTVIVNVQRKPVRAAADVQAEIDEAVEANRSSVLMLIRNTQGLRWVTLMLPRESPG